MIPSGVCCCRYIDVVIDMQIPCHLLALSDELAYEGQHDQEHND